MKIMPARNPKQANQINLYIKNEIFKKAKGNINKTERKEKWSQIYLQSQPVIHIYTHNYQPFTKTTKIQQAQPTQLTHQIQ